MRFCSVHCRRVAWSRFHFAGCSGKMTNAQKEAYNEFIHHDWEHEGVDYGDIVFLAFRFVCMTLTNMRLHGQSTELAYRPIAQLTRAPLSLFRFTYLFSDDESDDKKRKNKKKKRQRRSERWELFKQSRAEHVLLGRNSDVTDEFLSMGVTLVDRILGFTAEERRLFTTARWSELLGAVLLNGQERSPLSRYGRLKETVERVPGGAGAMRAFEGEVRARGADPHQLLSSTRGQGVYTVGCLFNHSCRPNLQVLYSDAGDELLSVRALRDIKPGEELLISYIDESLPYPERQQELYEHYLFTCRCPKCEEEAAAWEHTETGNGISLSSSSREQVLL